jgi:hypothetical protein
LPPVAPLDASASGRQRSAAPSTDSRLGGGSRLGHQPELGQDLHLIEIQVEGGDLPTLDPRQLAATPGQALVGCRDVAPNTTGVVPAGLAAQNGWWGGCFLPGFRQARMGGLPWIIRYGWESPPPLPGWLPGVASDAVCTRGSRRLIERGIDPEAGWEDPCCGSGAFTAAALWI